MRALILFLAAELTLAAQAITPASQTLNPGQTQQFTTTFQQPRWSWTGAGSLDQQGLYTAPAAVPVSPYNVVQVSVTDAETLQSAFATLMIIPALPPATGQSQFTAQEVAALKQMVNLILSGHWCFGTSGCTIPK